jgi:hypothetical protein
VFANSSVEDRCSGCVITGKFNASTEIHPCYAVDACTVESSSRQYSCADGHQGPLCGVCKKGWVSGPDDTCVACGDAAGSYAVVVVGALLALAALTYIALYMEFDAESHTRVIWRIAIVRTCGGFALQPMSFM